MKKIFVALTLVFLVSGCGSLDFITQRTMSPEAVYITANAFNALEITATNYLRLPKCKVKTSSPICRDPEATKIIIASIRSGRDARDRLEQFVEDHPGQIGLQGTYDLLKSAVSSLKATFEHFGIGTV